jgi:hypothetical protein
VVQQRCVAIIVAHRPIAGTRMPVHVDGRVLFAALLRASKDSQVHPAALV